MTRSHRRYHTLAAWRHARGLSQVAAAALVPVSSVTWCRWESGARRPARALLARLVALTGVSVEDLLQLS